MPLLQLFTNVARTKIPATFTKNTLQLIAELLGKPATVCTVHLQPDQEFLHMSGTADPCIYGKLGSISRLNWDKNKEIAPKLTSHIAKELGIHADRVHLRFEDLQPTNVAAGGELKC